VIRRRARDLDRTETDVRVDDDARARRTGWIIDDVGSSAVGSGRIIAVCALTLVAVVVLRILWVFVARYLLIRPGPDPDLGKPPPATYSFLLGWAGMRGVVTLAAAFVIPADTQDRDGPI